MGSEKSARKAFRLTASSDAMKLMLTLEAGAGSQGSLGGEINAEAAGMKVTAEIDGEAVEAAVAKAREGEKVEAVIARGTPARDGRDGKLLWSKKISGEGEEGGRLSHYLGKLQKQVVTKGQPVARLRAETEGTDGADIYGKGVRAQKGAAAKIRAGQNIREVEGIFYAELEGLVRVEGEVVRLDEIFPVEGDIDFEVGNIDFPGTVVIRGAVLDLFEVKAGGAIRVGGLVEAASLRSGGDIEIAGGVEGKQKGRIRAGGSVAAKFLMNANVYAEKDICVEGEVITSMVTSFGALKAPEGAVAGGVVRALGGVDVGVIGSETGVKTVVEAGLSRKLTEIVRNSDVEVKRGRAKLVGMREVLEEMSRGGTKRFAEKITKLMEEQEDVERSIEESANRMMKASALLEKLAKPVVVVRKMLYSGAEVRIGKAKLTVIESVKGPVKLVADSEGQEVKLMSAEYFKGL